MYVQFSKLLPKFSYNASVFRMRDAAILGTDYRFLNFSRGMHIRSVDARVFSPFYFAKPKSSFDILG